MKVWLEKGPNIIVYVFADKKKLTFGTLTHLNMTNNNSVI